MNTKDKGIENPHNVYYVVHMTSFGSYIRKRREALKKGERSYSLRQVARRIGVEPAYLSKIERDEVTPPSEAKIRALAQELGEDPDALLAMAGKVSSDLLEIIRKRPQLFSQLIRELKSMPEHAILRIVREVRDGDW
ncbi:helix-turn-helix domain-containing protein [Thiolapillus sp.]